MYYGNKTHLLRYSMVFAGLCMVVQPIGGVNVSETLKALYSGLPNMPYKKNITDFFSSKYGLGIVIGGTTLATLLFARTWYASRQQAAAEKKLQERIKAALQSDKALDIIIVLDELYKKYGWKEFHKLIIADVHAVLPSQVASAQRLNQLIEENKGNSTLCAALRTMRNHIEQETASPIVTNMVDLVDALIKRVECDSLSEVDRKRFSRLISGLQLQPSGGSVASPSPQTVPKQAASTEKDPEAMFSLLHDIYWRNHHWLSYNDRWGEVTQANNLLAYLVVKTGFEAENFKKLIEYMGNSSKKRSICAVLQLERYKLSKMAEQTADTKAALDTVSSLIEVWACEKIPQTISEIIKELNLLYQNNHLGKSFVEVVITLLKTKKQKTITKEEVHVALNDTNNPNCILVYSTIRNIARKKIVEQRSLEVKEYILLLIDYLLDLVPCKKAAEAAERGE